MVKPRQIHVAVTELTFPRATEQLSVAVPGHTDALMRPTVAADASVHVGGIGAVLEVVPAGCGQGGLERRRPRR
jgi:hypothetical protein